MNAATLFKEGRLPEAVDAQVQEVKTNPADPNRRLFLFELLAFSGDLVRARKQIDAVQYGEVERDRSVAAYGKLLEIEDLRRRLFSASLRPKFLSEPPEHARLRLEAVDRLRENRPAEASELLQKADAAAPELQGSLNDKPFTSLRDCDDVFASVLEVIADMGGEYGYYWVPLEQVASVEAKLPQHPRNLIWFPAQLQLRSGPTGNVFLPALYPNSHEHPDPQVKLGRLTDWKAAEGGPVQGVGLRMFVADDDALPLLEWRRLRIAL